MIGSTSLTAFTDAVNRSGPTAPSSAAAPVRAPSAISPLYQDAAAPAQRLLEAVPPRPTAPTPRGSLLDLRV